MNNVINFPDNEYDSYKERLDDGKIIYTTRVSSEVGKYEMNQIYESCFGNLKVVYFEHFKSLDEHPFLNELTDEQVSEINMYISDAGFDLVGLEKI